MTHYKLICFKKHRYTFTFHIFPWLWKTRGCWYTFSRMTKTFPFCRDNIMTTDVLNIRSLGINGNDIDLIYVKGSGHIIERLTHLCDTAIEMWWHIFVTLNNKKTHYDSTQNFTTSTLNCISSSAYFNSKKHILHLQHHHIKYFYTWITNIMKGNSKVIQIKPNQFCIPLLINEWIK